MKEMLPRPGIVRPSTSHFSSHVILVKKKMDSGDFAQTIEL